MTTSTYTTAADRVRVGDTLVDDDGYAWTVKFVGVTDRYTEAQALSFRLEDEAGNTAYATYYEDEQVTLKDASMTFDPNMPATPCARTTPRSNLSFLSPSLTTPRTHQARRPAAIVGARLSAALLARSPSRLTAMSSDSTARCAESAWSRTATGPLPPPSERTTIIMTTRTVPARQVAPGDTIDGARVTRTDGHTTPGVVYVWVDDNDRVRPEHRQVIGSGAPFAPTTADRYPTSRDPDVEWLAPQGTAAADFVFNHGDPVRITVTTEGRSLDPRTVDVDEVGNDDGCTECGYAFTYTLEGCDACRPLTEALIAAGRGTDTDH